MPNIQFVGIKECSENLAGLMSGVYKYTNKLLYIDILYKVCKIKDCPRSLAGQMPLELAAAQDLFGHRPHHGEERGMGVGTAIFFTCFSAPQISISLGPSHSSLAST
jgi:hypothetical protein